MIYTKKTQILLKNGETALIRGITAEDAKAQLELIIAMTKETDFLLTTAEEAAKKSLDDEKRFIETLLDTPKSVWLLCEVGKKQVGNCSVNFGRHIKNNHRATIGISVLSKYWGQGIGTALMKAAEDAARENGAEQLELEYIEGNTRARALYEKRGFTETGRLPNAIHQKDGTVAAQITMIKELM